VRVNMPDGLSRRTPRLVLTGCGTSFHAAMYGAHILQSVDGHVGVVEAIPAYDLVYGPMPRKATVLGVSHSGTTRTTNRALSRAKRAGLHTMGICGLSGSPMERIVHEILVIGSARDRSWANTMSYTAQLTSFAALAAQRGRSSNLGGPAVRELPDLVRKALKTEGAMRRSAHRVARCSRVTFLATGWDDITALEAALKIRETCGLTASGYHAEQFLHGPFLSLDARDSVVFLLAREDQDRASEIGRALTRTEATLLTVGENLRASIRLPPTHPFLRPVVSAVPMQFLAYYAALARHENPDIMRSDNPRFRAGIEALFH
jgi:glucosamine--fructose-6-phosphate aminotransferase (isomerizing)